MRRSTSPWALALLGLGVFLLVLAPVLAFYVQPRVKLVPIDIDQATHYTGKGKYFDQDTQKVRDNQTLTITRRVLADVHDSEKSGHAVLDASTTVDNPKTLPLKDPRKAFQWTLERWVIDRDTNLPVHCCGEKTGGSADEIQGEAGLKFPFDVEKRTYQWWDNTLQDTVPLKYSGKKKIQGYTGLSFKGKVTEAVKTGTRQVPGAIVGMPDRSQVFADEYYSNSGIELVADQRTGRILYAKISPRKTLRQPGGNSDKVVLLESKTGIDFTDATQRDQVDQAKTESGQLKAVSTTIPLVGGPLGLLLTALGVALVVRGRQGPDEEEPAPEGAPPQPVAAS
ncbi:DUF3068 domain-containing protein [Streptomyces boninensis]|uniref:DUF3068 domain-containing protein n=1 Tax=Streptomyces boninensis TaxID=2039455 RepID=UPI003B2204E0